MSRLKKGEVPYLDPKLAHSVAGPVLTAATQAIESEALPREPGARDAVLDARSVITDRHKARAKELLSAAVTKDEIKEAIHLAGLELAASEMPERHDDSLEEQRRKLTVVHEHNAEFLRSEPQFDKELARNAEHIESLRRANDAQNKNIDFVTREMKLTHAVRYLGGG